METTLPGELQSINSLALGNCEAQFELAGNLRGATPQTPVIAIGDPAKA
jgi:hypothetical protein